MEDNRIGIIYCPHGGSGKLWEKVQTLLDQRHAIYDFVQSENQESVERLAAMLTTNGYKTIVVMGGDSALNRALRGILSVQPEPTVALGVIPGGVANDFARYWGLDEDDCRKSVDTILNRRLRRVDVCMLTDADGACRPFLNCANVGLASRIISIRHAARRFGVLRWVVSALMLLFQRMGNRMSVKVNSDYVERHVMNLCIGSAHGYGLTPNAVPYSGLLDVSILSRPALTQMFEGLWLLTTGRFQSYDKAHVMRTRRPIRIEDTGGAPVSLDGCLWPDAKQPLTATLKPEHIEFIIPR